MVEGAGIEPAHTDLESATLHELSQDICIGILPLTSIIPILKVNFISTAHHTENL